jgi:quercetin 2,3-dioxygenase
MSEALIQACDYCHFDGFWLMFDHTHMNSKKVMHIYSAYKTMEGGLEIRRSFPSQMADFQDPFLLFDHMGPMTLKAGQKEGVSSHPHRGFETVTYMFEGEMHHEDSHGNTGDIAAGDVQWMTAGSGIVHSEFPSDTTTETGGILHGIQLWVNLPANKKMIQPAYQEVKHAQFPQVTLPSGGMLKVIAGEYDDHNSPISTHVDVAYFHVRLQAHSTEAIILSNVYDLNLVYAVNTTIEVANSTVKDAHMAQLSKKGDTLELINNSDQTADIMVLSGQSIGEPIVAYGPFVMNTEAEINQAIVDYRAGNFL